MAIGNEVVKGLLHGWAERWQIAYETAMFAAMVLLFAAVLGQGDAIIAGDLAWRLDPERTAWLLVGFGAFTFHYLQTQKLFLGLQLTASETRLCERGRSGRRGSEGRSRV